MPASIDRSINQSINQSILSLPPPRVVWFIVRGLGRATGRTDGGGGSGRGSDGGGDAITAARVPSAPVSAASISLGLLSKRRLLVLVLVVVILAMTLVHLLQDKKHALRCCCCSPLERARARAVLWGGCGVWGVSVGRGVQAGVRARSASRRAQGGPNRPAAPIK